MPYNLTLIRNNCKTHKHNTSYKHDAPHLPCLSKSWFSPYSLRQTAFSPKVAPRAADPRAAAAAMCSRLQHSSRCTGHFKLRYYTTAPTTCNQQFQYRSGRPAESSSIAAYTLNFFFNSFYIVLSRQYHRFETFNRQKWGWKGKRNRKYW